MKPCISVSYTVAVDTFYPTTATELSEMLGAASTSTLQIQFSRTVKYETVSLPWTLNVINCEAQRNDKGEDKHLHYLQVVQSLKGY